MNARTGDKKKIAEEVEQLIDQKIMQARIDRYEEQLIISKNQLNFFFKIGGALLAVVGLIFPILVTLINTERVNTAIELMEKRVERLLDVQLRKPQLKAILDGREFVHNSEIVFEFRNVYDQKTGKVRKEFLGKENYQIEIVNVGNGPAKDLRILLFLQSDSLVNWKYPTGEIGWKKWYYSNEPDYPTSLSYVIDKEAIVFLLDATEHIPVNIHYQNFSYTKLDGENISLMLKVFFGEPKPLSIPFKVVFQNVDSK